MFSRPSLKKMQKVAAVSIFNVLTLYVLSATFGYLTFFSELNYLLLSLLGVLVPTHAPDIPGKREVKYE